MDPTRREPGGLRSAGTGKTFLLEALGQAAVEAGKHVAWFTLEALGVLVRRHRADDSVTKAIGRILRADLVIVDDIGLLPVGPDAAEGLYRLVDAGYERRSVAVSSNLHPSGFDEIMPKTLATATVDRLLHHAHLCQTSGESVRLSQALTGKGVKGPHLRRTAGGHHPSGQIRWPPPFNSVVRHRADPASATVQVGMSLDAVTRHGPPLGPGRVVEAPCGLGDSARSG